MPEPLTSYIAECDDKFYLARHYLSNCCNYIGGAGNKLILGNIAGAGADLQSAKQEGQKCADRLHGRYAFKSFYLIDALEWIDDNWPSVPAEYELTWLKIAEAWIADDFAGRAPTIAVIDRMRQILWDEPFKVTWAARPEQEI